MGCWADFGWAWNAKPSSDVVSKWKTKVPSGEFVESLVIFTYGASNAFLEHLAGWGEEWTAMDLEHVSISIMFFGGGLVSVRESAWHRALLTAGSAECSSKTSALSGG